MGAAAWFASVMKGEGGKNPRRAFLHLARAFARPGRSSKVHDGQASNMMMNGELHNKPAHAVPLASDRRPSEQHLNFEAWQAPVNEGY